MSIGNNKLKHLREIEFSKTDALITSLCLIISLIGLFVVIGWHTNDYNLIRFDNSLLPMNYNSAILVILCGLGLWFLLVEQVMVCYLYGGIILLVGVTALIQNSFNVDLGIDEMFMTAYLHSEGKAPGRIPLLSSLSFIAVGIVLMSILMDRRFRLILFLGSLIFGLGITSFVSVIIDFYAHNGLSQQSGVSLYSAIAFSIIGSVVLLIEQSQNIQSTVAIHRRNLIRAGLVLFVAVIASWQSFSYVEDKKKLVKSNLAISRFELNLTNAVERHIKALQRMVKRWDKQQGTSHNLWEEDALNYIRDFEYFHSIKWIDRNYHLQWSTAGLNESSAEDLERISRSKSELIKARRDNSLFISKPSPNNLGVVSFNIYVPIFSRLQFDGFLMAELRFEELVRNAAKLSGIGKQYQILFSDGENVLLTVQQKNPELTNPQTVSTNIKFRNYSLSTELRVYKNITNPLVPDLATIVLILSTMFVCLLIWLQHLRFIALENAAHLESEAKTRHLIQLELAKNEERMRAVFNHIADAVILVSESGQITRINRAAERMFGISAINAINKDIKIIFPAPYNQTENNILSEHFLDSQVEHISERKEMVGIRNNGSIFNMLIAVSRFELDSALFYCVVVNDITDQKKAAFDIDQYTKLLEQKNKELESFAYVASHDLKAPLRGILQLATWIDEDLADSKSAATDEYLKLMFSRINRLQGLLDNLLEYSKIGKDSGELALVNLEQMIDNIYDLLDPPKGFILSKQLAYREITTLTVPLEIILRNLIHNSIKHHDKQEGHITVTLEKSSNSYYQFTITDDGPGILPEHHEKIFTMFQTLKPRDEVEGSGMGLSFVRKLIDIYHCDVCVRSDGARNTSFIFTWPNDSLLKSYTNEQL
jgi:PAS domain S-box-containing protein